MLAGMLANIRQDTQACLSQYRAAGQFKHVTADVSAQALLQTGQRRQWVAEPRRQVRSYNVGGVAAAVYDNRYHWLQTTCRDDIIVLLELHWGWRPGSSITPGGHCCQVWLLEGFCMSDVARSTLSWM